MRMRSLPRKVSYSFERWCLYFARGYTRISTLLWHSSRFVTTNASDVRQEGSGYIPPPSVCDSIKAMLRTARITNPPMLVSKLGVGSKHQNCGHNKLCIEALHKELIGLRYEHRITVEKAGDFGWLMPDQCFYILVASKIGLPDLPG